MVMKIKTEIAKMKEMEEIVVTIVELEMIIKVEITMVLTVVIMVPILEIRIFRGTRMSRIRQTRTLKC